MSEVESRLDKIKRCIAKALDETPISNRTQRCRNELLRADELLSEVMEDMELVRVCFT